MKLFNRLSNLSTFSLLSQRDFSILWAAQTFSGFGDNIFRVAQIFLLIKLSGSSITLSGLLLSTVLPNIFFALLGGAFADRFDRKYLLIYANSARGILMAFLTLIVWTNALQIWHLYFISFVYGIISAFANPAFDAMIPSVVSDGNKLQQANTLFMFGDNFSAILGPLVGGFLITVFGSTVVLAVNSTSFFTLVLGIFLIKNRQTLRRSDEEKPRIFKDIKEGLIFAGKNRALISFLILFSVVNIAGAALNVGLPFFLTSELKLDISYYGWFLASMNLGILIGITLMGFLKFQRLGQAISFSVIFIGFFGYILLSSSKNIPIALISVAVIDGLSMVPNILFPTWIQSTIAEEMRGRVFSIMGIFSYGLVPLGIALAGISISGLGASKTFLLMGVLLIFAGTCALLVPEIRKLRSLQ